MNIKPILIAAVTLIILMAASNSYERPVASQLASLTVDRADVP